MNIENVKQIFLNEFQFLKELGYDKIEIYENGNYDLGIILYNKVLDQKFSFAYYSKAPIKTDDTKKEYALFFALFKKGDHIDFSRLLKNDSRFDKYCSYQYFVIQEELSIEKFLKLLTEALNRDYVTLFTGDHWIKIDYDPRDDY